MNENSPSNAVDKYSALALSENSKRDYSKEYRYFTNWCIKSEYPHFQELSTMAEGYRPQGSGTAPSGPQHQPSSVQPPASRVEFWQIEAASKGAKLEAATVEIARLRAALILAKQAFSTISTSNGATSEAEKAIREILK